MTNQIKSLQSLNQSDLAGKTVLLRVDYNVPIDGGRVVDDLRIRASYKTIDFLRASGAKVILISHIEGKGGNSLKPVVDVLAARGTFGHIEFKADCPASDNAIFQQQAAKIKEEIAASSENSVFLLENLRNNPGEKANDPEFAKILASLADIYVGDAFSVSHREHASVVGLPALLPHYAGFQIIDEIAHLEEGLAPSHPFLFILGGAKFDTKLPLIEKFIGKADRILIGGALFNDILKAQGLPIGKSLVAEKEIDLSRIAHDPKLIIPQDVTVQNIETNQISSKDIHKIEENDSVMDMGPSLISELAEIFDTYKKNGTQIPFVLWNGPMGNYESGFKEQTIALAKFLIEHKAKVLLGGGDSSAAIADLGIERDPELSTRFYISTGGGAMIDYLLTETLPGIAALK